VSGTLILDNLVAYSLLIGMLVGLAGFIPVVLRLRQPRARLAYWHILLAACLLLPLMQPWRREVIAAAVQVTATMTAVHPASAGASRALLPAFLRLDKSEIAMLLLAAGFLMRLAWLGVGFWRLRQYRRRSRPLDPVPSWGVEASLRISGDISSPVTFGWRRPVVLLPAAFPTLDRATQDAILCHEVLHVRRSDWLVMVAEEVVRAAFWFHPAIWWLLGEIGLAREQEVDRQAIGITKEREEYMDALLVIAGAHHQLDLAPAPLFLRKRHLKQRVVQILKETPMSISKPRLISALAAGVAMLAAACWLATGTFPLMASPQIVSDAPGVTVDLRGATVLHRASVPYPAAALQQKVQGMLSVEVKLDAKGNVADAHVLSGPDELRRSALESVLQWHFTSASAGTTRTVQIAYELPKETETRPAQGVVAGVVGGVPSQGGVGGGVYRTGDGASAPAILLRQIAPPVDLNGPVKHLTIAGLPPQARDELLAKLPVLEGGTLTPDTMTKIRQTVRDFDEHLSVGFSSADGGVNIQILAPGSTPMMQSAPVGTPIGRKLRSMPPGSTPMMQSAPVQMQVPPGTITVGGNVQADKVVTKVQPMYPALAKSARVSGVVHLQALIAKDGTIQELHSLGGPALLIQAAMDAVRQWVYQPTLVDGQPVTVQTTIDVNFSLNQ